MTRDGTSAGSVLPPPPDGAVAARWGRWWWGSVPGAESMFASLFSLPDAKTRSVPLPDLLGALSRRGLADLVWAEDGGERSLYAVVGLTATRLPTWRKGGDADYPVVPGFWADLDVKKDGFRDSAQIRATLACLAELGVQPGCVVWTRGDHPCSGAQCYWRVPGGLWDAGAAKAVQRDLLMLVESLAPGVAVDRLFGASHPTRLPGSIRFPKNADERAQGVQAALVTLETGGPDYVDLAVLRGLCEPLRASWEARKAEHRAQEAQGESVARGVLAGLLGGGVEPGSVAAAAALSLAVDAFMAEVEWEALLTRAGWGRTAGPDAEGRIVFGRPGGRSGRSISVGYRRSPSVASLLSGDRTSPVMAAMHRDLDAGTALTKARVYAHLAGFGGDPYAGVVAWVLAGQPTDGELLPWNEDEETHG